MGRTGERGNGLLDDWFIRGIVASRLGY